MLAHLINNPKSVHKERRDRKLMGYITILREKAPTTVLCIISIDERLYFSSIF